METTVRFQVDGVPEGFALHIGGGQAEFLPGDRAAAQTSVETDATTLVRMATGRLDPREAVADGRLRLLGDPSPIDRWRELFRPL